MMTIDVHVHTSDLLFLVHQDNQALRRENIYVNVLDAASAELVDAFENNCNDKDSLCNTRGIAIPGDLRENIYIRLTALLPSIEHQSDLRISKIHG